MAGARAHGRPPPARRRRQRQRPVGPARGPTQAEAGELPLQPLLLVGVDGRPGPSRPDQLGQVVRRSGVATTQPAARGEHPGRLGGCRGAKTLSTAPATRVGDRQRRARRPRPPRRPAGAPRAARRAACLDRSSASAGPSTRSSTRARWCPVPAPTSTTGPPLDGGRERVRQRVVVPGAEARRRAPAPSPACPPCWSRRRPASRLQVALPRDVEAVAPRAAHRRRRRARGARAVRAAQQRQDVAQHGRAGREWRSVTDIRAPDAVFSRGTVCTHSCWQAPPMTSRSPPPGA